MTMIMTPQAQSTRLKTRTLESAPHKSTHISYSQLKSYAGCSLAWKLSRTHRPEHISATLLFGSAFHAAAEKLYQMRLEGVTATHQDLMAAYDETWARHFDAGDGQEPIPVRYPAKSDQASLHETASRMLEAFLLHAQQHMGEVIAVEEPFEIELAPDLPVLKGRIDLIEIREDASGNRQLHLCDFKTAARRMDEGDMVNTHAQTSHAYRIWTTEHDTVTTAPNRTSIPHHHRMAQLLPHVAGVRQKLLQTLLAEPKARWLGDKDAGRINPCALYRIASSQPENPGTGRVFRERVRTKRLHTAVTLLVDQSGSMDGENITLASNTALVFCEGLSRLDIPCSVVGFSTGDWDNYENDTEAKTGMTFRQLCGSYRLAPLRHTYFKHFHESFRNVSGRFDSMRALYVTPLGESILFAARELAERREERKVLLVITDVRPEVGLDSDAATFEHAKNSIKRVERAGIDVALVGIMSGCVDELHYRSVDINAIEELPKTVMRQLQSLLTGHRHIN